ncbi:hypothetical protein [Anaerotruncus sp. DFI.9.16]|uniref:hypothetical protein n=1 Tax=Anaerotruncus sp. DFI.9.16 TaxID=2965275 RepID=UPI00210E0EAA|nr:hypothetical protein [Anaerotruncus sp. DFI.9.16]MCQ4895351.1 hypothetical protein [Anaerotruncus sp. DFI.9.16]
MIRGRRIWYRWLAAALALLFACAGQPAFAEDAVEPAVSPTEKTLDEGKRLADIAFTAKDGNDTVLGHFAWAPEVPYDQSLTQADSGSYTVIFTPEPVEQNGKVYSEARQAVAVTVMPKESPDPAYDTASAITDAVRGIADRSDDEVRRIAEAMRALSGREQDRLSRSTLEKLDAEYCKRFGYTHETAVDVRDDGVSSNRIPRGSHAYGVAAATGGNRTVKLYQQKPSGSSVLQFELEVDGGSASLPAPIVVYVALPGNISGSRDYYLKSTDGEISASVSRDYLAFTTSTLGRFRLYRERSSGRDDDDDDDDDRYRYRSRNTGRDYVVTSFWESVIDAVHDAKEGDRLRVNIGARTEIPADLLRELKGRRVMLVLSPSRGDSVTIRGEEVVSIPVSRDYYTMKNLLSLYERGDRFDDPPASGEAAPAAPAPPPVARPPAAYVPAAPVYAPPAASSAPAESAVSVTEPPEEEPLPDVEIAAEEDDPPASSEEQPAKPQEPTGGEENPFGLALFAAVAVAAAALLSCVLTLAIWGARRRRGR